ncbi:MAG: hypothetical protein NTW51_05810 [Cyanobacteria bacterium]|nr:hypothetical protein [Cyanobacteriota bacterium]
MSDFGSSRQFRGIHICEGVSLRISEISFTFDGAGNLLEQSGGDPSTLPEIWFYWLQIAMEHLAESNKAHEEAVKAFDGDKTDDGSKWLIRELTSGMQCISAAAIAIDSLDSLTRGHIKIPKELRETWRKNRLSQAKQIFEVLRRAFLIEKKNLRTLRGGLIQLFKWRGWSVHPPADFSAPVLYDELNIGVDWRFVAFRAENAGRSLNFALTCIVGLLQKPKPKYATLVEHCDRIWPLLERLVRDWESRHGDLNILLPRATINDQV